MIVSIYSFILCHDRSYVSYFVPFLVHSLFTKTYYSPFFIRRVEDREDGGGLVRRL